MMKDRLEAALRRSGQCCRYCKCSLSNELIEAIVDELMIEIYAAYGPPF